MAYNPQPTGNKEQDINNQALRLEIDRLQAQIEALRTLIASLQG